MDMNETRRTAALAAVIGLGLLGGCSSGQPASAPPSPSIAPAPSVGSPSPSAAPSSTPAPTRTAPPSVAPSPSAGPVAGQAPDGPWTGLTWITADAAFPKLVPNPSENAGLQLYGWSHGYVAFGSDGGQGSNITPSLIATSSTDGLHWTAARPVDIGGANDQITIEHVDEGPGGLLAVGYFPPDTCGGPPAIAGLWKSTDGTAWKHVALPRDMVRGHVENVAGGSAGYIATGKLSNGTTPGIWLSQDGTTWKAAALPKPPSGTLVVNDGTSFAGGYVLAGAVIGPEGCGGASSIHPAVWWSADGTAWTREALPGGLTSKNASLTIRRLSDDELYAIDGAGDTPKVWISTDGRHWTQIRTPTDEALYGTIGDGERSIVVAAPDDSGPLIYKAVSDQLDVTPLSPTGDGPVQTPDSIGTISAVGPTGIVVVNVDGSKLWLGVPSGT